MRGRQSSATETARPSIAILTAASLTWNPRVLKEARSLAKAGFPVVVFGAPWDEHRLEQDRALAVTNGFEFEPVVPGGSSLRGAALRAQGKLGRIAFERLGIENRWQLGSLASPLLHKATESHADYVIAHVEEGIWAGEQLLRTGRRVGVDLEDWHSEDLLPEARKVRPIGMLRSAEATLLRGAAHATCPSMAMSEALVREYACPPPTVIYNAFPWAERDSIDGLRKDRTNENAGSIHWFSQTLGPGRGLEDLLAALPHVRSRCEVHLRGNPTVGFEKWLTSMLPASLHNKVVVHALVPHDQLISRISEHDIGFAGEMTYAKSRDVTITNKILQYLLGGLAVVASDTSGQREVAKLAAGAVSLYPAGEETALAARIDELLESPSRLSGAKQASLDAARATFCWERQEGTLVDAVSAGTATDAVRR